METELTGPDGWDVDWKVSPRFSFAGKTAALSTLDRLGEELRAARTREEHIMRYLAAAVGAAAAVSEDGTGISKQAIISHTGLARSTVYSILDGAPGGGQS